MWRNLRLVNHWCIGWCQKWSFSVTRGWRPWNKVQNGRSVWQWENTENSQHSLRRQPLFLSIEIMFQRKAPKNSMPYRALFLSVHSEKFCVIAQFFPFYYTFDSPAGVLYIQSTEASWLVNKKPPSTILVNTDIYFIENFTCSHEGVTVALSRKVNNVFVLTMASYHYWYRTNQAGCNGKALEATATLHFAIFVYFTGVPRQIRQKHVSTKWHIPTAYQFRSSATIHYNICLLLQFASRSPNILLNYSAKETYSKTKTCITQESYDIISYHGQLLLRARKTGRKFWRTSHQVGPTRNSFIWTTSIVKASYVYL